MTYEEYISKVDELSELYKNATCGDAESRYDELSKFQESYMCDFANNYSIKADTDAKRVISSLINHAVYHSTTGNSIVDVESKELADEIDRILYDEIGDYLLDAQVYPENNKYVIDVMFGGAFIPYWDGWN